MDLTGLGTLGKIAGIGGLAIGLIAMIATATFKHIGRLARKQIFVVVILVVVAAWTISGFGLYIWWDVATTRKEEEKSEVAQNTVVKPPQITEKLPITTSPTNTIPVKTRTETLKIDLKKPINKQIQVFDGDSLQLTGGALGLITRVNFGDGLKNAKKGQTYTAKVRGENAFTPKFETKKISVFGSNFDAAMAAKSAVIIVEITATTKVDQPRNPPG